MTDKEQKDASRRQQEIREHLDTRFEIETGFLTGSYKRWTKTKPLKHMDIFCVLGETERHYRSKSPSVLLGAVKTALIEKYGRDHVEVCRRSVTVDFGVVAIDDETGEQVICSVQDGSRHSALH